MEKKLSEKTIWELLNADSNSEIEEKLKIWKLQKMLSQRPTWEENHLYESKVGPYVID